MIRCNFWEGLKKFISSVGGVQSYFLNFPKNCTLSCQSNVGNIKKISLYHFEM